jgi:hypothetical protein
MKLDLAVPFSGNVGGVFHVNQKFFLQPLQRRADFASTINVRVRDRHQLAHSRSLPFVERVLAAEAALASNVADAAAKFVALFQLGVRIRD